jgi:indole-3-glycerol phosphate synthase
MILDEIVDKTIYRINKRKEEMPLEKIKIEAESLSVDNSFLFEKALKTKGMSFICEVKKASPSKGIISEDFNHIKIAKDYENAGASAISVLTEPYFFKGKDSYLKDVVSNVKIPVLRKDFVIDSYMIYEAKIMGASAILLICSLLNENTLKNYIKIAKNLGLSSLVEAHNKEEIEMAKRAGATIIGVNNRNLKTFVVDIKNSILLRSYVPNNILFVSESGIKKREDIVSLEKNNVDAVLIGETLMNSLNKASTLYYLKGE